MLPDFERMLLRAGDEILEIIDARRASAADQAFRLREGDAAALAALLSPAALASRASRASRASHASTGSAEITAPSGERFTWPLEPHDLDELLSRLARGEILIAWRALAARPASPGLGQQDPAEPGQPAPGQGSPGQALSFYEIVVLDELETPIAGLRVTLSTPAGTITTPTDGAGRVRVDDAPPGVGRAYVTSGAELAAILAGRERRPRRTAPLPEGPTWQVRLASEIGDSVALPDAEPQRLMIVTRTDLRHFSNRLPWRELSLSGEAPCALDAGEHPELALCANAQGAQAVVVGAPPPAEGAPPPEGAPEWLRAGIDALHAALFRGDFAPVWALLESIPLEPPVVRADAPPPLLEQLAFEGALAELMLEGRVDPPLPEDSKL